MNTMPIAPPQSNSKLQPNSADTAGGTSDADEGFGPILQAASGQPTGTPAQDPSQAQVQGRPGRSERQDHTSAPASTPTRRTKSADPGPQPAADASAAAAAGAVAVAPGIHLADAGASVLAPDTSITPSASVDPRAGRSSAIDPTGAASALTVSTDPKFSPPAVAPDAGSPDRGVAAVAQVAAPAALVSPQLQGAALTGAAVAGGSPDSISPPLSRLQSDTPRADRAVPGDAERTSGDAMDAIGDDAAANSSAANLLAPAVLESRDGAQAVAQAVADARTLSESRSIDNTPSHAGPAATTLLDLGSTTNSTASAALGTAPAYASDVRASVATPLGHPGFAQDLSQQVVVLAKGGVQSAQISLEPAGLGPVNVSIQVHGHAATLAFSAAHEATRGALEAALPRLREMFASSGLQLSDATVGGRSQSHWTAPGHPQTSTWDGPDSSALPSSEPAPTSRAAAVRLVDTYA
jgi:flagellar hook-length control protein FliK